MRKFVLALISVSFLFGNLLAAPVNAVSFPQKDLSVSEAKSVVQNKKRLSKKKAKAIYIDAVCTANRASDAWVAYDANGNFDLGLLQISASNYIAAVDYSASSLSGKSWPKNVKKSWINTMISYYEETSWQLSRYLTVTNEEEYLDAENRYYNEFSGASLFATDKIRRKLGLPPAPGGC